MLLSLKVKVPGKLYILGEYNVLKSGHTSLSMAVDRFVTVEIKESKSISVFENDCEIDYLNNKYIITKQAIDLAVNFIKSKKVIVKTFQLKIKNDLILNNVKLGLGSSAALKVGICQAILNFHNVKLSKLELFKLLVLNQIKHNNMTSGGDLATSIFGGYVLYERYNFNYVKSLYKDDNYDLIYMKWPLLKIKTLENKNNYFNAIFSGKEDKKSFLVSNLDENFYIKANESVKRGAKYLENNKIDSLKDEFEYYCKLLLKYNNNYFEYVNEDHMKEIINLAYNKKITLKPSGSGINDSFIYIIDENEDSLIKEINKIDPKFNLKIGVYHYEQ